MYILYKDHCLCHQHLSLSIILSTFSGCSSQVKKYKISVRKRRKCISVVEPVIAAFYGPHKVTQRVAKQTRNPVNPSTGTLGTDL